MSFQQNLSGLDLASKAIELTSNNIANSSTVGFKGSTAHFSDLFAASLSGASANSVGIGASVSSIFQSFTQGNLTATNNPLDLAINGSGFYRLEDASNIASFTRNGQFKVDKSGFVVNDQGLKLTGYTADAAGVVKPKLPTPIQISASDLPPSETKTATATLNLDSRVTTASPVLTPVAAGAFTAQTPFTSSTAMTAFDSLGNEHTYTMFFRRVPLTAAAPAASQWEMFSTLDANYTKALGPTTMTFDSSGALLSPLVSTPQVFNLTNGATSPLGGATGFTVDFKGTTQFGNSFSVNQLTQDGFTTGRLAGLTVSADGMIQGGYTNGQSRDLAQIVLANFTNPNGLASRGNNQWSDTADSGPALIGTAGTGRLGVIQSAAVEESNVDLTAELVALITQQRNYQANAQAIKTEDQIMSALVNLR